MRDTCIKKGNETQSRPYDICDIPWPVSYVKRVGRSLHIDVPQVKKLFLSDKINDILKHVTRHFEKDKINGVSVLLSEGEE